MKNLLSQISFCLLLSLLWQCGKPLPEDFKIVRNQSGDKYAIQSGWSGEGVDEYNEKQARYKY